MNLKTFLAVAILSIVSQNSYADTVTVKATKEVMENVKTSTPTANYVLVESKDGTKQAFKKSAVAVVSLPVVWEEPQAEKPGLFGSLFTSKATKDTPNTESTNSEEPKENPENQSFLKRRFPELAIGGMALLWILLP
ncbi:LIMLP_04285 family protein [Leptospira kanakyensis]|uniref:Uncharacterized protein n=1 Tax=Leptospira kanakyensis TaxID=2484968 RepID=A0A6N4QLH0_9LEPT|nr:hypothetical protein [Leptospira kanakyensis]MCW7470652.1 hypothetical protein [Leptospira kanakyensis]MCW7481717.1 hypothetical protein [Leptospira kanakyensis]TGK53754.1 hypothetical protein EHQ11_05315 [Leptospira kanakyensis]TGK57549.1 hypothetical protein EHQ16_17005 [Leptospira kanakyensis]TGK73259.1 hypothetical protein EHQ18_05390 [Leptospira kanakyensis]